MKIAEDSKIKRSNKLFQSSKLTEGERNGPGV